ncbi:NF-kappa-B inhibitor cactus-like [Mya arenaria]|uniref:NF-kappa-B inhibitor cactus-like n=1 Tax=Mya arenaria TaxID=6604 RepID=UPI0022DF36ED|nr:NF-kappa-B inhibitor cactus-like [Mya arenaria]XP_052792610.1 NF-kappa-B inhibitor cactus-like [Mya arenaria]
MANSSEQKVKCQPESACFREFCVQSAQHTTDRKTGTIHTICAGLTLSNTCVGGISEMSSPCQPVIRHQMGNVGVNDIYAQDDDGDTRLHVAVLDQDADLISLLIRSSPHLSWISQQNFLFQSPLHLAVITSHIGAARMLVCAGASWTVHDVNGNTPLHIACRDGHLEMAKTLLQPVNIKETMVHFQNKRIPQELSVRNYDGLTCAHLAANRGHVALVQLLVIRGAEVNVGEGKTGRTCLHNACIIGDVAMVRALLQIKTCDINARAYDGRTPFDLARARGHEDVCMLLAAQGAILKEDSGYDLMYLKD